MLNKDQDFPIKVRILKIEIYHLEEMIYELNFLKQYEDDKVSLFIINEKIKKLEDQLFILEGEYNSQVTEFLHELDNEFDEFDDSEDSDEF